MDFRRGLRPNIDQRKVAATRRRMANARSAARVPKDETVVGLIDATTRCHLETDNSFPAERHQQSRW